MIHIAVSRRLHPIALQRATRSLSVSSPFRQCSRPVNNCILGRSFATGKKTVPFILADIGEGIAEVELMQWFVAEGDILNQFDNVCEVQSDKATVEITSRYDGVVKKIHHQVGEMIQVGSALVDIEVETEGGKDEEEQDLVAAPEAGLPPSPTAAVVTSPAPARNQEILTTPAVRKIAKENAIDLSLVTPTGPNGRILKSDVLAFVESGGAPPENKPTAQVPSDPSTGTSSPHSPTSEAPPSLSLRRSSGGSVQPSESTVVPISGIQRIMVRSMNESLKIPHFTFTEEVVMDALADIRGPLNEFGAAYGVKMSYLPLIIKALSLALEDYPVLNSSVSQDETSITYHHDHNVGVAMDTPRGLLVPCIKQVQEKSVFEIATELVELQAIAQAGKLGEAHLSGGTITVSNMGSIGGTVLSPVIMAPQTAIVALGRIQTLPRFSETAAVAETKVMNVSWAGDHRIIDGATMANFVNTWKRFLENPALMIAQLK